MAGCLNRQPRRVLFKSMQLPCAIKAQDAVGVDMRFDTRGAAGAVKRPVFRTLLLRR